MFTQSYYFSDLTDSLSDPERGYYTADYSVISIGDYVFTSSEVSMSISCAAPPNNHYIGKAASLETGGVIYIDSVPYEYNSIDWVYNQSSFYLFSSSGIPDSDEFPSSFPDLAVFDWKNSWSLGGGVETNATLMDGVTVRGEITSIEVIPEPCSVLLLGVGGLVLFRRRGLK